MQAIRRTKSPEQTRKKALAIVEEAKRDSRTALLESEAEQIAKLYGIPVAKSGLAQTEKEALTIAKKLGFPLAMKVVSPDILHKSDIGAVKLGLTSGSEVRRAFKEIIRNTRRSKSDARVKGVYIQSMAPKSHQFVVGGLRDPQFGPTIMFGLGGIYVELFKDVAFRLAPISHEEAISMMKEIKSAPLLTGFRGSKPLDLDAGAGVIISVGKMMADIDAIDSIDINPLFIYQKGAMAVDVRIILKTTQQIETASS